MPTKGRILFGLGAAALLATLAGCGGPQGTASEDANAGARPGVIEDRQATFERISDALKSVRAQLETDTPDFAVISAGAEEIRAESRKIAGFFPEGTGRSSGADTEALDTIWEQPAQFSAAIDRFLAAGEGVVAAARSRSAPLVSSAVEQLGGACRNCHDSFRLDDD